MKTKDILIGLVTLVTLIFSSINVSAQGLGNSGLNGKECSINVNKLFNKNEIEVGEKIIYYLENDTIKGYTKGDIFLSFSIVLNKNYKPGDIPELANYSSQDNNLSSIHGSNQNEHVTMMICIAVLTFSTLLSSILINKIYK